jgi:hypothetical protein
LGDVADSGGAKEVEGRAESMKIWEEMRGSNIQQNPISEQ